MDLIVASSRGKFMEPELRRLHPDPSILRVIAQPGAKLHELALMATEHLPWSNNPTDCHIYFLAGLCDLTYKDYDPRYSKNTRYDEVFFIDSPQSAMLRMTDEIQIISESILSFGFKPCFCTIVPCSLRMWNETRVEQHKTSFLLHHTQYEDMQTNLITAICNINKYIISLNTQNKMYTPYIADTVISHCGPKKAPRVHYNRLKDGIHPTSNLRTMWINKMIKAMKNNRPL